MNRIRPLALATTLMTLIASASSLAQLNTYSLSDVTNTNKAVGLTTEDAQSAFLFAQAVTINGINPGLARLNGNGKVKYQEYDNGIHDNGEQIDLIALQQGALGNKGESGSLDFTLGLFDKTITVNFARHYQNPAVFAQIVTQNGAQPISVQVAKAYGDKAVLLIDEPAGFDGKHVSETIHWMVVEQGQHIIDNLHEVTVINQEITYVKIFSENTITVDEPLFDLTQLNVPEATVMCQTQDSVNMYNGVRVNKEYTDGKISGVKASMLFAPEVINNVRFNEDTPIINTSASNPDAPPETIEVACIVVAQPFGQCKVLEGVEHKGYPVIADFDDDGDMDLLIRNYNDAQRFYYENTGTATQFEWTLNNSDPIKTCDLGNWGTMAVDIDLDGDLDILGTWNTGRLEACENLSEQGTRAYTNWNFLNVDQAPAWFQQIDGLLADEDGDSGCQNKNSTSSCGIYTTQLSLVRSDAQTVTDIMVSGWAGSYMLRRNNMTGSEFALEETYDDIYNYMTGTLPGAHAIFTFADLNGDGTRDLLTGNAAGDIQVYENQSAFNMVMQLEEVSDSRHPLANRPFDGHATPVMVDLNGNGKPEMLIGHGTTLDGYCDLSLE